jgi:hypothetical protein
MGFIRDAANWLTGADDVIDARQSEAARQDVAAKNFQNVTRGEIDKSLSARQEGMGDIRDAYSSAAGMLDPYMRQGDRFRSMYEQSVAGGPSEIDPELMSLIDSPVSVGPLNETAGYENMLQARREAMGDLATSSGMGGKSFSGSRMEAASDISGELAGNLYDKEYERALNERNNEISNRIGLDREKYNRGQTNIDRMFGLDNRGYQTGVSLGDRNIRRGETLANMGIGGQRYDTGLMLGGQQYADQIRGAAGSNRLGAAQAGQGALGDLWGAAGALGGKFLPDDFLGLG